MGNHLLNFPAHWSGGAWLKPAICVSLINLQCTRLAWVVISVTLDHQDAPEIFSSCLKDSLSELPARCEWLCFSQPLPTIKFGSFQGLSLLFWVMISAFQSISHSSHGPLDWNPEPRIPAPSPNSTPKSPKLMELQKSEAGTAEIRGANQEAIYYWCARCEC
jgi:hypothetical protein